MDHWVVGHPPIENTGQGQLVWTVAMGTLQDYWEPVSSFVRSANIIYLIGLLWRTRGKHQNSKH